MSDSENKVELALLRKQLAQARTSVGAIGPANAGGGEPPHIPDMPQERLAKLEGVVDGLKHGQTQLLVSIGVVAAFVVGFGIYTLQRIDSLADKVNDLPSKISSELRDITRTLATSITATKQQVPQVIIAPLPVIPQPAPPIAPVTPHEGPSPALPPQTTPPPK